MAPFDVNNAAVIKEENLFLVTEHDGSIPIADGHPLGLYYNDCRFLNGWELEVLGQKLHPLVCSAAGGDAAVHELTNDEMVIDGGVALPAQALQVRVERDIVRGRTVDERIALKSFHPEPLELDVALRLRAGFEPMMWIRGMAPGYKPKRPKVSLRQNGIEASVTGRDGVERSIATVARPRPSEVRADMLRWRLTLLRGRPQTIALRHAVSDGEGRPRPTLPVATRRVHPHERERPVEGTTIRSDDELFNRILNRSLADLRLLRSRLGRERYYAAGIPWYATVFGRDTLITGIQMLGYNPRIAEETLRVLAHHQGQQLDDSRDEEPGKILHEVRVGELSNLGLLPFARYYGSVDSTPLFLCLLAEHADWAGNLSLFRELSKHVDAALEWIDRWGDRDGDGLLEYERRTPEGLLNQGWKDSWDGIQDARGQPLQTPIALVEAQGYAMRAKRRIANVFDLAGQGHRAERLREEAIEIRERIESFWLERERFYSMALDARKRPSRALASNQGHLLWALAVSPQRAAATRDALMDPRMFCGWGIRTLAEGQPGYNPVGYHNGSVWPHDTALAAYGLRKYGYDEDFTQIFEGLLEAASRFPDYRLPELFGGYSSDEYEVPVPYPVACHPQAWASGSIPYLLMSGLGVIADGLSGRLRIIRPSLPRWLERVDVEGLRVGAATVCLSFVRREGAVTIADVDIDGDLEVVLEISATRDPEFGL
ncbi:MAG: glycogen debranching N-terminal domain-containing protein [Thermoleophilaceae bacterium]